MTRRLLVLAGQAVPAVVLAVLGGVFVARDQSLWYDELFTAEVAAVPLGDLVGAVLAGEGTTGYLVGVPPSYNAPYYVVVHLWLALTRLPNDALGLRLLSLVAAVAAVAVLTAGVSRLGGRAVGVTAGLLAATNPLVVEYAAEARGYGLAMLAVAVTALGLARWLDGGRLLLYAVGATGAGLAHWFALPVVAGLALAGVLLRRPSAGALLAVTALAALPTLLLVGLTQVNGIGDSAIQIQGVGLAVPVRALSAWTTGSVLLLVSTLLAVGFGVAQVRSGSVPARRAAVVGACWVGVPLTLVTLAELARPVFVPRYLLAALLGLSVLAALGTARLPRTWHLATAGVIVAASLLAASHVYSRPVREDARGAVAHLAAAQSPGEPVVAVDRRAALALEHYAEREQPRLLADLVVPPDDPPPGARTVWLLRETWKGAPLPSDDDDILRAAGLRVIDDRLFPGRLGTFLVQRWST